MTVREISPLLWPSDATLVMPGSKSEANRVLVAAALCGSPVVVTRATPSEDVRHMVNGLTALGYVVRVDAETPDTIRVRPRAPNAAPRGEIFCGNAGTTLRFLVSVAAITPGEWTLTGDAAMQRRPIRPLVDAWRQLGVEIEDTNGCPPVRVRCERVPHGGAVRVDGGESSQFVSSLMLVAPALADGLEVVFEGKLASRGYVALTRTQLERFGVRAALSRTGVSVSSGFDVEAHSEIGIFGDWSSAGVWFCANHLTGSAIDPSNLLFVGHPDRALLTELRRIPATGDHAIDVRRFPDQFMNLAIVAAHRAGTTRVAGSKNLRIKESDRIAVMARELAKVGVDVDELPDGIVVRGGNPLRPAVIDPENDHRIAMAFALAGLLSPGISIANPNCVTKSYPRFWEDLETVRTQRRCVVVVGMRGAGKSTFARALAARTDSEWIDTDDRFVAACGPIAPFVAEHGWPQFREREWHIVVEALSPHSVISVGGGAVENDLTRSILGEGAHVRTSVVWLDADAALLRSRLAADAGSRPSVTGAPVLDEIETLLARRNPLYAEIAHVRIDASLATDEQVAIALRELGRSCRWPGSA